MSKPDLAHHLTDQELAALEKRIVAKTEGIAVTENDVYELIDRLGRDADKSFAEAVGDAIRRILSKCSQEDSGMVSGLVINFGLEGAMEMLERAQKFAEATRIEPRAMTDEERQSIFVYNETEDGGMIGIFPALYGKDLDEKA